MIAPVKVQRLRANESGVSRFDTFEIEREMTLFAPPAQPFPSERRKLSASLFGEPAPGLGTPSDAEPPADHGAVAE
jgi:hypothetical protein